MLAIFGVNVASSAEKQIVNDTWRACHIHGNFAVRHQIPVVEWHHVKRGLRLEGMCEKTTDNYGSLEQNDSIVP